MGKIYKIVCNITGEIYIGSTKVKYLCSRIANHKAQYKRYKKGLNKSYTTSYKILERNNYKTELIELCDDDKIKEREQHYINKLDCINKNNVIGKNKENRKEYLKKYVERNKDKRKNYLLNNKDYFKQKQKEYTDIQREWQKSFGGRIDSNNNSLLKISMDIFD